MSPMMMKNVNRRYDGRHRTSFPIDCFRLFSNYSLHFDEINLFLRNRLLRFAEISLAILSIILFFFGTFSASMKTQNL